MSTAELLGELRRQVLADIADAQSRLDALQRALAGLDAVEEVLPSPSGASRVSRVERAGPTMRDAVLQVLAGADGPMADRALFDAAQLLGWRSTAQDPLNTLRAELHRMKVAGLIEREGDRGPYYLVEQRPAGDQRPQPPVDTRSNGFGTNDEVSTS